MARTTLNPTVVDRTGNINTPALVAMDATNLNNFPNNGRVLLEIKGSTATATLTILVSPGFLADTQPGADLVLTGGGAVYSVIATADFLLGPFPPLLYNQSDGTVWCNPSSTNISWRAIQLN